MLSNNHLHSVQHTRQPGACPQPVLTAHGAPEQLAGGANVLEQQLDAAHAKQHAVHHLGHALAHLQLQTGQKAKQSRTSKVQQHRGEGAIHTTAAYVMLRMLAQQPCAPQSGSLLPAGRTSTAEALRAH